MTMIVLLRLIVVLLLNSSLEARKNLKRRLEILHKGKPLEELVTLGAHVDPHDVKGLAEFIKPKLIEETQQESVMLQQNGVEDPFPLDATIEFEGKKKFPKPIIATAFPKDKALSYEDPDNTKFNLKEMPEYDVETKADYQGNQEAADWLMHDPNRFNIMPQDDVTKGIFSDEDSMNQSNDNQLRLGKHVEKDISNENYEDDDYSKYPSLFANAKFDLSETDKKIIEKAYRLDDEDSKNSDFFGVNHDDERPAETLQYLQKSSSSYDLPNKKEHFDRLNKYENDENSSDEPVDQNLSAPNTDSEQTVKLEKPQASDQDNSSQDANSSKESTYDENQATPSPGNEKVIKISKDERPRDDKMPVENSHSEQTMEDPKESSQDNDHEDKSNQSEENNSDDENRDREGGDTTNKESSHLIPVYRISKYGGHDQSNHINSAHRLSKVAPLSESGTSREHVLLNSDNIDTEELPSRLSGLADMMFSKTEDERIAGLYNLPHQTNPLHLLHSYARPQVPVEGQSRHGIPTKFGQWNGWSKCSVSCSKGTQIRARICLRLPCQSRDLFQTRSCGRNICPDEWREESLRAHNRLRELHHSPPLTWSNSLERKAKNLADTLASMDYIGSQDLHEQNGENIAQLRQPDNDDILAQKAVDLWNKEASLYSYSYPQLTPSNRHFVQMVWKKTKTLGMASTRSRSGEYTFVVALYGGPDIDNKHLRDNVLRSGHNHDVYTTFKRSKQSASIGG